MTPAHLAAAFVTELVAGLRSALGSNLVAAYLYGSAVAGGFDEGVSDVDLLVVAEQDLDADAVARLSGLHAQVVERHPDWNDRLELVYVGRETLAHFRDGGHLWVISPGEPFHRRADVERWVSNFFLVRQTAITLVGPEPRETIPSLSWTEFRTEVRRYADEVCARDLRSASPGARAYNVLTICRAFATISQDKPRSKQQGAAAVRSSMPDWAWLIDEAERCRLSRGQAGFADEVTLRAAEEFVALIGDKIARFSVDQDGT